MDEIISFITIHSAVMMENAALFVTFGALISGFGFVIGRLAYSSRIGVIRELSQRHQDILKEQRDAARRTVAEQKELLDRLEKADATKIQPVDPQIPEKETDKASTPQFHIVVRGGNFFQTEGLELPKTGIILDVYVWNTGSDGSIVTWRLDVMADGFAPEVLKVREIGNQIKLSGTPMKVFRREDSILEKLKNTDVDSTPIEGVVMFVSDIDQEVVVRSSTRIKLMISDNHNGTAIFESSIGEL